VVTGGNRGIGYGLVQSLSDALPKDSIIYLAARDPKKGDEAIAKLRNEGRQNVRLIELDIARDGSVASFAMTIKQRHGGLDILIGNAGLAPKADQFAQIDEFFNTNNMGTHRLIRVCGPLLKDGALFLTGESRHGIITDAAHAKSEAPERDAAKQRMFNSTSWIMSLENRKRFYAEHATLESIEAALDDFKAAFKSGRAIEKGWPDWINIPSKAGQVASTLVFARDMKNEARRRDILINACCPGFVDTDATRYTYGAGGDFSIAQTPRQAADKLVWIVTQPPEAREPYGQMLREQRAEKVHD